MSMKFLYGKNTTNADIVKRTKKSHYIGRIVKIRKNFIFRASSNHDLTTTDLHIIMTELDRLNKTNIDDRVFVMKQFGKKSPTIKKEIKYTQE